MVHQGRECIFLCHIRGSDASVRGFHDSFFQRRAVISHICLRIISLQRIVHIKSISNRLSFHFFHSRQSTFHPTEVWNKHKDRNAKHSYNYRSIPDAILQVLSPWHNYVLLPTKALAASEAFREAWISASAETLSTV